MKELPANQLDPKVKNVWRINDALWITVCFACLVITARLIALDPACSSVCNIITVVLVVVWAVMLIVWLCAVTPIRYARWRYELSGDYLDIAQGIIWRKRYIIPFIRVQNTDTRQGPFLRLFHLATTTVSTAAGDHPIPGLSLATAEALRDKAAELARLAREDV